MNKSNSITTNSILRAGHIKYVTIPNRLQATLRWCAELAFTYGATITKRKKETAWSIEQTSYNLGKTSAFLFISICTRGTSFEFLVQKLSEISGGNPVQFLADFVLYWWRFYGTFCNPFQVVKHLRNQVYFCPTGKKIQRSEDPTK